MRLQTEKECLSKIIEDYFDGQKNKNAAPIFDNLFSTAGGSEVFTDKPTISPVTAALVKKPTPVILNINENVTNWSLFNIFRNDQ